MADTPQERASVPGLNLPFGRVIIPNGAGLDGVDQRAGAAAGFGSLWGGTTPPPPGGGGVVGLGRLSALNLNLPINRGFLPDGNDLSGTGERYLVGLSFRPSTGVAPPPPVPRVMAAISEAAGSFTTGALTRVAKAIKVKPPRKVLGRTFDWDSVVASAERAGGGTPGPRPIAVYTFGSGRNRRSFTELQ